MRRNNKKIIIIAIILVLLIIIGVGTYYFFNNKKVEDVPVETKKEKYKVNKLINKNNLTFEIINQDSNVVEHTIILDNIEDKDIYNMKIVESSKGYYYIVTINAIKEEYYRVYNKDLKKISEDLYDDNNQIKAYDEYEVLSNGNIKLTRRDWFSENALEYDITSDGYLNVYEYTYNQEGKIVSQNSSMADYITPQNYTFVIDSKNIYVFSHDILLDQMTLEKTSQEAYATYICEPSEGEEVFGYNETSEWIHFGNRGANAKKYVYNYQTGKLTKEDSNCLVE